jgi:hypothetical protein
MANGEQKRPPRQQLPDKEEICGWVRELNAELTGSDKRSAEEAARLCRRLALRAAKRLGLVVSGIQPGAVLQGDRVDYDPQRTGVILKSNVGVTAETTK